MPNTSNKETFYKVLPFIIAFIIFTILAIIIFISSFASDYVDFIAINAAIAVSIVSIYSLYQGIIYKTSIKVFDDRIEIKCIFNIFNKTVFYNKIEAYTIRSDKKSSSIKIYIKEINKSAFSISEYIDDEQKLISNLTSRKIYNEKDLSTSSIYFVSILLIQFFLAGFILVLHNIRYTEPYATHSTELVTLKGTIDEIKKTKTKNSSYTGIKIVLKEYPDKNFIIEKKHLKQSQANIIVGRNCKNKLIKLKLYKRDYHLKITKKIVPSFDEKYFGWRDIKIYGIASSSKTYYNRFNLKKEKPKSEYDKLSPRDKALQEKLMIEFLKDSNKKK